MLPYKIRKPVYGGSNKKASSNTDQLYGNDQDPRIHGGNLQRAILSDLVELKSRYVKVASDANQQHSAHHRRPAGHQFVLFKRAFREARFGCIHNRVVPPRIDRGEYAQLIYSSCLYLLDEALQMSEFDLDSLSRTAAASSDGDTDTTTALHDAIFAIFALYTLHQTNTLPDHAYTAKETFHHPSMHREEELQRQWSHLPLGQASEGRIFRRYYKSPVRIDRESYLSLMYVRDVCAAIVAKCNCGDTDTTSLCDCSLAKDGVQILDRMLNDDNFFAYSEYHGPVGLEGLAGNPIFYMAYYGAAIKKGNAKNGNKPSGVRSVPPSKHNIRNVLTEEKLQSISPSGDEVTSALDLPPLSSLLEKHKSNLQSIQTELQSCKQKHQSKQHQPSGDLQPRQREVVEKTLSGVWPNEDNTNPFYVNMIDSLSGLEKPSNVTDIDHANEQVPKMKERQPSTQEDSVHIDSPPQLPITLPSSFSSTLVANIRDALSDFDAIVEAVRLNILKDRNTAAASAAAAGLNEESNKDVDLDAASIDFSAIAAADTSQRSKPQKQTAEVDEDSMMDEVSVATGAGRKALSALLSASAQNKQTNKQQPRRQQRTKCSGFDNFWGLQGGLFENEPAVHNGVSCMSDGVDEFSVSTGAGHNALSTLLALSEYDKESQPKKRKRQNDPIIDAESSDDGCSSVSDASFQVGKIALQSLLDIAQVSEKPSSKRAKRSPHSANKTTNAPKPAHAKRKSEPVIQDDISEATGGGKQALAELLSSL